MTGKSSGHRFSMQSFVTILQAVVKQLSTENSNVKLAFDTWYFLFFLLIQKHRKSASCHNLYYTNVLKCWCEWSRSDCRHVLRVCFWIQGFTSVLTVWLLTDFFFSVLPKLCSLNYNDHVSRLPLALFDITDPLVDFDASRPHLYSQGGCRLQQATFGVRAGDWLLVAGDKVRSNNKHPPKKYKNI